MTAASQGKRPDSYLQFLDKDGLPGARIGVLRQLFMGPDTDPEILKLLEQALADMKRQGAEIVEGGNIPEIDEIPPANLFCNRFKYDIEAYLAGLGPQAPVKNLDEILASQKFHPSIEKRGERLDSGAESNLLKLTAAGVYARYTGLRFHCRPWMFGHANERSPHAPIRRRFL